MDGEVLRTSTRESVVKVDCDELALLEFTVTPEWSGPLPHVHREHVDSVYVLEGQLELQLGDGVVRLGPGDAHAAAPGTRHEVTNPGPGPTRFLNLHTPSCGFVEYLRKLTNAEPADDAAYDVFSPEE